MKELRCRSKEKCIWHRKAKTEAEKITVQEQENSIWHRKAKTEAEKITVQEQGNSILHRKVKLRFKIAQLEQEKITSGQNGETLWTNRKQSYSTL